MYTQLISINDAKTADVARQAWIINRFVTLRVKNSHALWGRIIKFSRKFLVFRLLFLDMINANENNIDQIILIRFPEVSCYCIYMTHSVQSTSKQILLRKVD